MPNSQFFITLGIAVALTSGLRADENLPRMRLADDASPSYSVRAKPTIAELRQARALEQQRQRIARMEANAWSGYSPLRPTVSANPYTQSRRASFRPRHIWSPWDLVSTR